MKKILFVLCFILLSTMVFSQSVKYYEGKEGKDISIVIPLPIGTGIAEEDEWVLTLIQTHLLNLFKTYSPVKIIARDAEEYSLAEIKKSESISYSESEYIELGKMVAANHIVLTKVIAAGKKYNLNVDIIETETNTVKYSYNSSLRGDFNFTELRTIASNEAVYNLLLDMGIQLTSEGKNRILGKIDEKEQKGNEALSKAIYAEKNDATVESMIYFYEAAEFISSDELKKRATKNSDEFSNKFNAIQGELAIYKEWRNIIEDAKEFFSANPPYEIFYNQTPYPEQNFSNNSVDFIYNVGIGLTDSSKKFFKDMDEQMSKQLSKDAYETLKNWYNDFYPKEQDFKIVMDYICDGQVILSDNISISSDSFGDYGEYRERRFETSMPMDDYLELENPSEMEIVVSDVQLKPKSTRKYTNVSNYISSTSFEYLGKGDHMSIESRKVNEFNRRGGLVMGGGVVGEIKDLKTDETESSMLLSFQLLFPMVYRFYLGIDAGMYYTNLDYEYDSSWSSTDYDYSTSSSPYDIGVHGYCLANAGVTIGGIVSEVDYFYLLPYLTAGAGIMDGVFAVSGAAGIDFGWGFVDSDTEEAIGSLFFLAEYNAFYLFDDTFMHFGKIGYGIRFIFN